MYTDGGSYNNGDRKGDGSWAYLIVNEGDPNEIIVTCEFIQNTTNNRTEMMAVIEGLKYLNKFDDRKKVSLIHNHVLLPLMKHGRSDHGLDEGTWEYLESKLLEKMYEKNQSIRELAEMFEVSVSVMTIRLDTIGLI